METNLRQVTIVGRVGQDATAAPGDNQPSKWGVAVNQWNPDTKQEETVWVQCSAFDRQGQLALTHIKKGKRVWATGKHSIYKGANGDVDQLNVKSFGPAELFPPVENEEEDDGGWE